MEKKIKYTRSKILQSNRGFSLVEVLVALGMLGVITTGTMKIIQQQTKGQKTISIRSEMQNLQYRIRTILRSDQGCMETLTHNSVGYTKDFPFYDDTSSAFSKCINEGATLKGNAGNDTPGVMKGNTFIKVGDVFGKGSGAPVTVGEIKIIFEGPDTLNSANNITEREGVICYSLITKGIMKGSAYGSTDNNGQISRWFEEPILVKNVYNADATPGTIDQGSTDPERITNCNSNISSVAEAVCSSLGGHFNTRLQECQSINLEPGTKDVNGNPVAYDTPNIIAERSAVTAQGNISASGSGVFCGNLSIGMKDDHITAENSFGEVILPSQKCDVLNNQNPGNLYVGNSITAGSSITATDGIFMSNLKVGDADNGITGYLPLNGTLEVIDTLIASAGSVSMKNLIVQDAAQVDKNLKVSGEAEIVGPATINKVVIKQNSIETPGSLSFTQGQGTKGDYTFNGRVKAINSRPESEGTAAMDYLATVGYVDALMLSTMTDENKRILFQKLLDYAEQTGIDILREDFLSKIGLTSSDASFSDKTGLCVSASNIIKSVKVVRESDKVTFDISCGPMAPPPGTPTNCKWYRARHPYDVVSIGGGMNRQYKNEITQYKCPQSSSGSQMYALDGTCLNPSGPGHTRTMRSAPANTFEPSCKDSTNPNNSTTCSSGSCAIEEGQPNNPTGLCNSWRCRYELLAEEAPGGTGIPGPTDYHDFPKSMSTYNSEMMVLCCEISL